VNSDEYGQWWQLHVRTARGETLTPQEQSAYEAALRGLDSHESLGTLADARHARQQLIALEAEHSRLEERRRQLGIQIEELEGRLGERTRELLKAEE
jgi:predicted nuclease with TOPRIM domain